MVDIGFKNSSNSDRNEGPTPPPDWSTIVVDYPPPPPSFDVPVKFPACFEATLTFLAIKVSKDGSWSVGYPENVPIRGWGIYGKPPGHRLNPISFPGTGGPPVTKLPPGMGKDKYNSMFDAILEMQKKVLGRRLKGAGSLNPWTACHIIKMCICCPSSLMWRAYQAYLATPFCPAIVSTAHSGGWFKVLSDTDGDWWIYLNFTLEHVCDGCENPYIEECGCEGHDQIDLTDKIKSGPPIMLPKRGQSLPPNTSIYTDSRGNEHIIPDSGGDEHFKEVLKKILEIEDELFDCTK